MIIICRCAVPATLFAHFLGPAKDLQTKFETAKMYREHLNSVAKDRAFEEYLQACCDFSQSHVLAESSFA